MLMSINVSSSVFQNLNLCNEKLVKRICSSGLSSTQVDYFKAIKDHLPDKSENENNIEFKTNNTKKETGLKQIVNFIDKLTKLVEVESMDTEKLIQKLCLSFKNKDMSDLNDICKYFISDRAKRQGGEYFHWFIKALKHLINAVIKILNINNNKNKKIQFDKIVYELEKNITRVNSNTKTYILSSIAGVLGGTGGYFSFKGCVLFIAKCLTVFGLTASTSTFSAILATAVIPAVVSSAIIFIWLKSRNSDKIFKRARYQKELEAPSLVDNKAKDNFVLVNNASLSEEISERKDPLQKKIFSFSNSKKSVKKEDNVVECNFNELNKSLKLDNNVIQREEGVPPGMSDVVVENKENRTFVNNDNRKEFSPTPSNLKKNLLSNSKHEVLRTSPKTLFKLDLSPIKTSNEDGENYRLREIKKKETNVQGNFNENLVNVNQCHFNYSFPTNSEGSDSEFLNFENIRSKYIIAIEHFERKSSEYKNEYYTLQARLKGIIHRDTASIIHKVTERRGNSISHKDRVYSEMKSRPFSHNGLEQTPLKTSPVSNLDYQSPHIENITSINVNNDFESGINKFSRITKKSILELCNEKNNEELKKIAFDCKDNYKKWKNYYIKLKLKYSSYVNELKKLNDNYCIQLECDREHW